MTQDVILLSGMGPTGLSDSDLLGTRFDSRYTPEQIAQMYTVHGVCYDPVLLTYHQTPVFRKNQKKAGALVTRVLESMLEREGIAFTSVNLRTAWTGERLPQKQKAKIVCLSTTFMWSGYMLQVALDWIQENVEFSYLILGGKYASLKREKLMRAHGIIDYIIVGDGETALPALIRRLLAGNTCVEGIPNLICADSESFDIHTIQEENMEQLPMTEYSGPQEVVMYESVRGCVFHCKFCAWSVGVERFRSKSAEKILSEWKRYIDQNGTQEIQVIDSTFFIPPQRMGPLLDQLPGLKVKWKANARTDFPVTAQYVKKLEESGCVSLKFGFESMSDKVLGYIDKRSTAQNNRNVNTHFKDSSIDTIVSFIVGFPGETPQDFAETEQYLLREHYGHFHLYIFEMEDECMPIWKERERYGLQVYSDHHDSRRPWEHGGLCWSHNGMDSAQAQELKRQLLSKLRKSEQLAVHRTWQGAFESPLVPSISRQDNIRAEKLLDQLFYLPVDYPVHSPDYDRELLRLVKALEALGYRW